MRQITTFLVTMVIGVLHLEYGVLLSNSSKRTKDKDTKWWNLAKSITPFSNLVTPELPIYINPRLQPLTRKQRRLVTKNPGTVVAIAKGARMAVEECQFQFRNRRWNCPTADDSHGGSVFGDILKKGCRETAFVYAITSAAVTHSIARACSEGSVYTCSCGNKLNTLPTSAHDWEWGGCSDNVKFGHRFSRDFVDVVEKGRDLRCMTNLHNNEAGRKHVTSSMQQECKCHGMSGSCTLRTCWMKLRHFRLVGNALKDKFDGASRVYQGNAGNNRKRKRKKRTRFNLLPMNTNHKPPGTRDLVYFEDSPTFCEGSSVEGYQGTVGRECNATSIGVDGCDLMCCGRGYTTEVYQARERCSCTFLWCCEVKCQICNRTKQRYKCL